MSNGADLAARTLRAHGIGAVFALCGDHVNPLFDSLHRQGIRIVDTRDERAAAWMAAGWALATGTPGVVVVSNTPALAAALPGLYDSTENGTPVLCITGGVAVADRGRGHPGDRAQADLAAPWVHWTGVTTGAEGAGDAIERGLLATASGARGAGVLEFPLDHQQEHADRDPVLLERPVFAPDANLLGRARAALASARRPIIIAGEGCFWSDAADAIRLLAERARIPVFTARAARGLVPDDHELCFGFPNLLRAPAQAIFAEADVALVVGARLDLLLGGGSFHDGCTVIRIDGNPDAFSLGRVADIALAADPRSALASLADGAAPLPTADWLTRLSEAEQERREHLAARAAVDTTPLHPGRLVAELAAHLPRDAMVSVDAGALALWAIDGLPALAPSGLNLSSASAAGALGMGVPWAIGMKLARPDRPAVALVGDGSFGFSALEIETAARHGTAIAVVVGNDGGWGIVRHLQGALHGTPIASDLPVSPYEVLAEFAGAVGDRVDTPQRLAIALTNALVADTPSVINAIIDPTARHDALPLIEAMFRAR